MVTPEIAAVPITGAKHAHEYWQEVLSILAHARRPSPAKPPEPWNIVSTAAAAPMGRMAPRAWPGELRP